MAPAVERVISDVVRRVLPEMHSTSVAAIASHLTSDLVGVGLIDDLKLITQDLLPGTIPIPIIKKRLLVEALHAAASQAGQEQLPLMNLQANAVPSTTILRHDKSQYEFIVPFNTIPISVVKALKKAKDKNRKVSPKVIDELKKAIVAKLVIDYDDYKENHPEAKKHPGRHAYRHIAKQIVSRYGIAVKETVKGVQLSAGGDMPNFVKQLEEAVHNSKSYRNKRAKKTKSSSSRVSVIAEEYEPEMIESDKKQFENIREDLVRLYGEKGKDGWLLVEERMQLTYPLQRLHILETNKRIMEDAKKNSLSTEEEMVEEEGVGPSKLHELRNKWPFLFITEGLNQHCRRLMPRQLEPALNKFIEEDQDLLIDFFITSSSHNFDNLVVLRKSEKNAFLSDFPSSLKFGALLEMISNEFSKDIDSLILTVEKTSQPNNFKNSVLDEIGYPCIVALDHDKFSNAAEFVVCTDKEPMATTSNHTEAMVALFHLCFALDLEYPQEHIHLFEFMERFVFSIPTKESRIRKRGQPIPILTERVKKIIHSFEAFKVRFLEVMEPPNNDTVDSY